MKIPTCSRREQVRLRAPGAPWRAQGRTLARPGTECMADRGIYMQGVVRGKEKKRNERRLSLRCPFYSFQTRMHVKIHFIFYNKKMKSTRFVFEMNKMVFSTACTYVRTYMADRGRPKDPRETPRQFNGMRPGAPKGAPERTG